MAKSVSGFCLKYRDKTKPLSFADYTARVGIDQEVDATIRRGDPYPEDGTSLLTRIEHAAPAGRNRHGAIDTAVIAVLAPVVTAAIVVTVITPVAAAIIAAIFAIITVASRTAPLLLAADLDDSGSVKPLHQFTQGLSLRTHRRDSQSQTEKSENPFHVPDNRSTDLNLS